MSIRASCITRYLHCKGQPLAFPAWQSWNWSIFTASQVQILKQSLDPSAAYVITQLSIQAHAWLKMKTIIYYSSILLSKVASHLIKAVSHLSTILLLYIKTTFWKQLILMSSGTQSMKKFYPCWVPWQNNTRMFNHHLCQTNMLFITKITICPWQ